MLLFVFSCSAISRFCPHFFMKAFVLSMKGEGKVTAALPFSANGGRLFIQLPRQPVVFLLLGWRRRRSRRGPAPARTHRRRRGLNKRRAQLCRRRARPGPLRRQRALAVAAHGLGLALLLLQHADAFQHVEHVVHAPDLRGVALLGRHQHLCLPVQLLQFAARTGDFAGLQRTGTAGRGLGDGHVSTHHTPPR